MLCGFDLAAVYRRSVEQPDIMVNTAAMQLLSRIPWSYIFGNQLMWTDHVSNICKSVIATIYIWLACTGVFFLLT